MELLIADLWLLIKNPESLAEGLPSTIKNRQSDVTNGTFPSLPPGATLLLCPPERAAPNTVAPNAKCPKPSASAISTAASARPYSKSAFARTASCIANPAVTPATTKPPI